MNKILLFVLVLVFCLKAKAQVTNDDCVNATQITLDANGNACVNGTTANALGVTYTAHPCWPTFQDIPEVWYTFVTSGTDNTITVTPTGGTPAQQVGVTVMSTNCAAPINNCDVSATNGGAATTNWTYVVGTQVWVNVGSMVSTGGFQICISSNTPPPNPGGSCATATTLCNKNPFTVATFPNNSNGLQPSCFPTTFQRPVFYQFTVGTSGTCGWTAAPNGPAEFDWVMYDITGGCPNGASPTFNCNFNFDFENGSPCGMQAGAPNNCPNDGSLTSGAANEFCPLQNVVAGNTYMIIIDNWTDDNTGFDFSFGGSFTIAPTAQFTMSANTSCAPPLNVTFTNTSTTTVSQTWNFGNGNTSTAVAGPAQTYTASGTYIVSLTGVSATGCPDVFTQNITVGVPPTVTVPANTTVCAGVTIPAAVFTSTPAGATYTWTNTNTAIGLGASGSANIPAFTATNATGAAITGVVSVTPTLNGCVGAPVSYTITVDPTPSIPAVTSQTVCAGVNTTAINFNPTPATATVNWTNSDNTIGVGSSGAGDIAAFAGTNGGSTVLTGNFVATPTENGCTGTPQNFSITVNPIPSIPAVTSQTVCAGVNTAAINFNPTPGTATVNWTNSDNTIGVGASGAGNIAAFAGTNAGSVPATGNFVATPTLNGCTGTAQNFAITVNPTPSIPAVTSQTVCVGVNTAAINFNPTPATATVNWTNSDNTIGVGSSGAGDIAAFAGINAGSTVLTGNFVATPTENGCTGTPRNFSITVNPIPSIPAVTSQTVCAGVNTTAITFNPTPATATVNWTNSDNTIGVGSSGAGDIAAFVGVNAGSTTVTGNFVATPTENGCTGTSQNFAITVNPTPSIPAVTSQTVCAGVNTTTITFNPTPATATVNWTNSDNTIGVGASGAGDIAAFTGTNTGSTVLTGNFVATPTENGCTGTAQNFSITVDPIPSVPTVADQTVCAGVNTAAINFNPTPGTATVNWTNSDNSIGVGSSGAGNIAAFAGVNGSSSPVTGNFVATPTENGCDGVPINFSITVNPIPSIPAVTSQTVCAGVNTTAITFNPTPATATVNWTNSDNTIGVGAFGAGDIAAFTGTNTGSTVLTGNFVATPTENGCTGTAQNFSITVDPIPSIPAVTSQTVCAGANTVDINFGPTPGTATVNWTNSDNTIGVGSSGAGDIAAFTGTNTGSTVLTGNFVATPTENGCDGVPINFSITVNPIPSIPTVTSQTVCAGVNTTAIIFNPTPATATVNWTNSDNTIGVGSSGAGDIAAFAGVNAGSIPVTGNFVATPTENGCTGTAQNFAITVNPTPSIPTVTSQTVCAGVNTADINFGPTPATATVNWTNSDNTIGVGSSGAGDIVGFAGANSGSTVLTGNFVATPTENGCDGTPRNFSITVNPLPTIPVVANQTVCANSNTTAIDFVSTPVGATINWTNSDGSIGIGVSGVGNIGVFTGINSGTTAVSGNFSATPTLSGCIGTAQNFAITVNPLPTVIVANDTAVCVNGTINFTASGGTSYIWSGPNSFSTTTQNPVLTSVTSSMEGVYTVNVTDANTCVSTGTRNVTVNPLPTATISSNSPVCMNGTINLNAGGGVTYSWSGPNGFFSSSAAPSIPSATAVMAGNYGVVVTDPNGCSSPDFTTVNIVPLPTPFAGSNSPVCEEDNLLLSLSQPYASYAWTGPNAFASSSQNPTVSSVVVASAGTYSVTVTDNNGCVGSTTTPAVVNPLPNGTFMAVPSKCAPLCDTLVFVPQINNIVAYSWDLGPGMVAVNNDSISHCYNSSGSYDVAITLTDVNSCSNIITELAWVTVYENPVANFNYLPDPISIFEPTATFYDYSTGPSPQSYDWQFGNPLLGASNSANPTFTFPDVGVYDVTLTIVSADGCSSTVVKPIPVLEDFAVYIPNAFTPNGDGDNETFGPVGIGIDKEKYHLYIYDRWGEKIFESSEYGKNWDGKRMGSDKISQEDVYIFKFECRKLSGEKFTKSGHVTLVR